MEARSVARKKNGRPREGPAAGYYPKVRNGYGTVMLQSELSPISKSPMKTVGSA